MIKKIVIRTTWLLGLIPSVLLSMFFCGWGIAILYKQVVGWLKAGTWTSISVRSILPESVASWILNLEWVGARSVAVAMVEHTPLSLVLVGIGILILYLGIRISFIVPSKLEDRWDVHVI